MVRSVDISGGAASTMARLAKVLGRNKLFLHYLHHQHTFSMAVNSRHQQTRKRIRRLQFVLLMTYPSGSWANKCHKYWGLVLGAVLIIYLYVSYTGIYMSILSKHTQYLCRLQWYGKEKQVSLKVFITTFWDIKLCVREYRASFKSSRDGIIDLGEVRMTCFRG